MVVGVLVVAAIVTVVAVVLTNKGAEASDANQGAVTTVMPTTAKPCNINYYCNETDTCLQLDDICNGYPNCPNSFDELSCTCTAQQYKCNGSRCLNSVFLCDGVEDCPNGDDESHPTCVTCTSGQFKCHKNNTCVDYRARCNGVINCPDMSDEKKCLNLATQGSVVLATWTGNSSMPMCWENSNTTTEALICKMNGFKDRSGSRNVSLSSHPHSGNYVLVDDINANTGIVTSAFTSTCSSGLLELNCTEYECGTRAEGKDYGQYIINGYIAVLGAWPWYALLNVGASSCGGVLIDNKFILTAAHCVVFNGGQASVAEIRVSMGMVKENDPDLVSLKVSQMVVHPGYNSTTIRNDLALLRLTKQVTYSDLIRPLCISSKVDNLENAFKTCIATGFGTAAKDTNPDHLLQTRLNIYGEQKCESLHDDNYSPQDNVLCVGSTPGIDRNNVCYGDSGGGLSCMNDKGVWFLVGINSYVFSVNDGKFGENDYRYCQTGVVTHVAKFFDWIEAAKTTMA